MALESFSRANLVLAVGSRTQGLDVQENKPEHHPLRLLAWNVLDSSSLQLSLSSCLLAHKQNWTREAGFRTDETHLRGQAGWKRSSERHSDQTWRPSLDEARARTHQEGSCVHNRNMDKSCYFPLVFPQDNRDNYLNLQPI